jgi:predicted RNA-binding protein with PIN domain
VLIIDGYNVVHAAAMVDPRLGTLSVARLCAMLAGGRYAGGPVLVVCDGTGGRAGVPEELAGPEAPIRVVFAGPGKDADSAIERLLEELEHRGRARGCTVVSSDRRVQAAAQGVRGGGCRRMSSEALVRELLDDLARAQSRERARGSGKPAPAREGLDEGATAYWLAQFGVQGDGRAAKPTEKPREPEAAPGARPEGGSAGPSAGSGDDDLLRQALQEWGDRLDPADLDTGKWLNDPDQPPPSR